MELADKIGAMRSLGDYTRAWNSYRETVLDLIEVTEATSVLEIGGGRFPFLTREEIERLDIEYASNDISARELALAPDWVDKAHFDVQTGDMEVIAPYANSYDFAFSKMVMEHVASYERAYRNLFEVLRPGGVTIAFHPLLRTAPFIINRLMPERLSAQLLRMLFPHRVDDGVPKFPAVYSGCYISEHVRSNIRKIGFREVWQVPFYGHNYYKSIPIIRDAHKVVNEYISKNGLDYFASYAYTIALK